MESRQLGRQLMRKPLENMIRFSELVLLSLLLAIRCSGSTEHAGDKDLAELKKMKGVAISSREGEWAESLFFGSRNRDLVSFSIGWLPENDLLGKGFFKKRKPQEQAQEGAPMNQPLRGGSDGGPHLMSVELFGTDRSGRTVFVSRLDASQIAGGEFMSQFAGGTYNIIEFSLDRQLLERSFIRFWEYIGPHGTQWTDVYLGKKPALRQLPDVTKTPVPAEEMIPGLEPVPGVR